MNAPSSPASKLERSAALREVLDRVIKERADCEVAADYPVQSSEGRVYWRAKAQAYSHCADIVFTKLLALNSELGNEEGEDS